MLKRSAHIAVLFLVIFAGRVTALPLTGPGLENKVDDFVRAEMARQQLPGVAVGIFSKGEIVAAKGYGFANVEHRVPVSSATLFQSASIGKQFTALAVMLQVEDGKLTLDQSVRKIFPDAPPSWQPITVRHLLTHTSGIADYFEEFDDGGEPGFDVRLDHTEDELRLAFYKLPLEFAAGSSWHYSNTGYALLGIIVRRVSGQFYGDVLKERVFTPLGMKTARVISEEDIVENRAAGYRLVDGVLKNQEWYAPSVNTMADGALYLSLLDFLAWERGLRVRAIVSPRSWKQILAPVELNSGKRYPYGFGWVVEESNGQPRYHHSGSSQGFKGLISRYTADDLTIVVLANLIDADPSRFVDGIAAIIDPALTKLRPSKNLHDNESRVAERVRGLLGAIAAGTFSATDMLYSNHSSTEQIDAHTELLRPLGALQQLKLIDRRELGDDHASTFLATYTATRLRVQIVVTPGGKIAELDIEPE